MRKLIGFILFLALLGYPLIPAYGAEITVRSPNNISLGNFAAIMGEIPAANTGDTIVIRLRSILYFNMSPTSGTASGLVASGAPVDQADWGYSQSGSTVTLYPETDGITWRFFAIGTP